MQQFQQAQGQLSSALSRLMVVVEKYPDLKANQNFLALQSQLEGSENRISVERNKFNEVTRQYNTTVKTFPNVLFAGMFGFQQKGYFQADAGARSEEHTSELQSLMRTSYAVFCLQKKNNIPKT